jgi:FkbM family methyltransferase
MNLLTQKFQNYLNNKDIREFKNKWTYYFLYRIARLFFNSDIIVNIFNFKVNCSYKKNKLSNTLIKKCTFTDVSELKIINKISKIKQLLFIDCGANYGFYSLYAASLSKNNKIFAYEASLDVFNSLKENIILNNFCNIEYKNLAVAEEKGKKLFLNLGINDGESSLVQSDFNKKDVIEVTTTSLDQELRNFNLNNFLSIIKIDVEGGELNVMKGGIEVITKYKPLIILEISRFNLDSIEKQSLMEKFLLDNNYSIYDVFLKEEKFNNLVTRIECLKKKNQTIGNYFLISKGSKIFNILFN